MANVRKQDRVQDTDIKRLNHVGLGLKAIADELGCHAATVTTRLKALGISPTDTRRSFLEQVFKSLTPDEQEWLSHNLYNAEIGIKDFVVGLIKEAFAAAPDMAAPSPAPMPQLQASPPTGEPGFVLPQDFQTAAAVELIGEVQADPSVLAQARSTAEASVDELASASLEPEYVSDRLETPLCGICHENAVARDGDMCASCGTVPAVKTESVFG